MSPDTSMVGALGAKLKDCPDRIDDIAPIIASAGDRIEQERRLTSDVVAALRGANILRLLAPKSIGGDELDPASYFRTTIALGKLDGSTAWCVGQGNGCAMAAAYVDPAVAKDIWGPNGTVAWGPGKGEVAEVDGGYRVSGEWSFCSGSRHASHLGGVITMPKSGGGTEYRTMLIPVDKVTIKDVWNTIGMRGTGTDAFAAKDVFVPKAYSVIRDDPAQRRESGPLYKFASGAMYAIGFSGVAVGMAHGLLADFMDLATVKVPRRSLGVLRESAVVQSDVAVAHARLGAAKAFMLSELVEIWQEAQVGELSMNSRFRIRLASTFAIHEAKAAADIAYEAAGATAVFRNNTFERRFRDIHTLTQQGQGRKSHFQAVGSFLLGLPAQTMAL